MVFSRSAALLCPPSKVSCPSLRARRVASPSAAVQRQEGSSGGGCEESFARCEFTPWFHFLEQRRAEATTVFSECSSAPVRQ